MPAAKPPSTLLDASTTPGRVITELHAWIATHADGSEGIMGAGLVTRLGPTMMTLLSSNIENARSLQPHAQDAMAKSKGRGAAEVVAIRLETFKRRTDA